MFSLGLVLAFLSALSFAFSSIFISRTSQSRGDKGVFFSVIVTLIFSFGLWLLTRSASGLAVPGYWLGVFWFSVAGLSVMVFGRTLVYESTRRLGVSRASAVKRLNPLFTIILAGVLLHEVISAYDLIGAALIALAFSLLIRESLMQGRPDAVDSPAPGQYLFGVFAAVAYAIAYIGRKLGLNVLPDAALGTFISAVAGLAGFCVVGLFSSRHRRNLKDVFAHLDRWIVLSALMISIGQILFFAALAVEKVTTVVVITSLEVFVSMFLAVVIFRTERLPGFAVLLSAGLATIGVIFVAIS